MLVEFFFSNGNPIKISSIESIRGLVSEGCERPTSYIIHNTMGTNTIELICACNNAVNYKKKEFMLEINGIRIKATEDSINKEYYNMNIGDIRGYRGCTIERIK